MATDHKERADKFRKLAEDLRQLDRQVAERQVKEAQLILRASKGLYILRKKIEDVQ